MASRGSRRLIWFVGVVVVLLGLLVAADRIGVTIAEHVVASRLQSSQSLSGKPSVDIDGFPFLTQLADSHFDEVTVDADGVPIGRDAHGARLQHLHAVLHDVRTADSFHQVRAGTLTATGSTSFAELSTAVGIGTLSYAGDGRVALRKSLTIAGETLTAAVTTLPVAEDGALHFRDTKVEAVNSLLGSVLSQFTELFDVTVPIDALPFHLRPTALSVSTAGVSLTAAASDVDLTSAS